jgi:PAT family beta-lactamase induction signal transducer AmpG
MASVPTERSALILTQSRHLRLLTLLLFYFTQGFPIGLFYFAIPGWMGASGGTTAQIAAVVGAASLAWSLKLVNGFVIDRYTFLPMGRRRVWIIGAQLVFVAILIAGALLAPEHSDIALLSAIAFVANMAITVQDVGIDSLAVDIMDEGERAKAGGIMFGAQFLGIAAATAMGGALLAGWGVTVCLLVCAVVPGAVALYGVLIRERDGERRLPWSAGQSHPANIGVQVEAWWPLLVKAFKAMIVPLSLLLVPALLYRALPVGGFEAFHPVLFNKTGGWSLTEYTNFNSILRLVIGLVGLVAGGWMVAAIGAQRALLGAICSGVVFMAAMGSVPHLWSEAWVLAGFATAMEVVSMFIFIALIPICMRMCSPAVAATQFTIYMATANFGRPLGAWLAAVTAGEGQVQLFYWSLAACGVVVAAILFAIRLPTSEATAEPDLIEPIEN